MISIEHDPAWLEVLKQRTRNASAAVDLRLIPLEHDPADGTVSVYDPIPRYVAEVSSVAERSLDVCLVDGHYRQACVLAALSRIRPGGLLVIDDTHWLPLDQWGVPREWTRVATPRPA